jgi:hypothetical protein
MTGSWIALHGSSGRGVRGTADELRTWLALATALSVPSGLKALRERMVGRPPWLWTGSVSVGEALHASVTRRGIDEHTRPGWVS